MRWGFSWATISRKSQKVAMLSNQVEVFGLSGSIQNLHLKSLWTNKGKIATIKDLIIGSLIVLRPHKTSSLAR
jgi:hypothetical protein